ncbi:MAG: sulfatase [Cyclobacteriaceae bacterium]
MTKTYSFFLALLILIFTSCQSSKDGQGEETVPSNKPNIILILADDYGIMDTQAYAKKILGTDTSEMFYETPNIDRLVKEGVSFSQAYANQLCSPTRASILTGRYAAKLGFTTAMPPRKTYYNQNMPVPEGYYPHDVLEHKDAIPIEQAVINGTSNSAVPSGTQWDNGKDELSIAEALKDYHSAFIGKWHLGGFGAKGYQPADHGFEPLAWFDAGGSAYFDWKKGWNNKIKNRFPDMPQEESEMGDSGVDTGEEYLTDDLTEQAIRYIDKRSKVKDEPFFLYFCQFAVHSPYQGVESDIQHFDQKESKGWNNHKDPIYASMIKRLDMSVGRILSKLQETGIEENTLVVFMSDNGGIDAKVTPNGRGTDNSPFLGGKACVTEGGVRVPLIFRWKGKVKEGEWVDVPVDCTDIYPTILEAAGYNAKATVDELALDGESVLSLLDDTSNAKNTYSKKEHYWHYPFNVIYNSPTDGLSLTPHSAMRDGDYKLIFDWYGRLSLYNVEKDPYEKNNLVNDQPELTNEMFKKLITWIEANVEKRYWPQLNPDYNPANESHDVPFIDLYKLYQDGGNVAMARR